MNGFQLSRQVQYLLRTRKWGGSASNENVFKSSSVRITPIDIETMLGTGNPNSPVCKINIGARTSDQQRKGLVAQEINIVLAVQVEGDEMAENATVGANRSGGKTSSKGRGLSEVESEMFAVLEDVNAMNGMQIQGYSTGSVEVARIETASAFVYCEYTFLFFCTTQLTYIGVTSLVATGVTGGEIALTWKKAAANWAQIDAAGGQIIKYAAGSTPPATHTSGLDGPAITGLVESSSIVGLASGTYAVSLFTAYKESGAAASADGWSPATSFVVVVP